MNLTLYALSTQMQSMNMTFYRKLSVSPQEPDTHRLLVFFYRVGPITLLLFNQMILRKRTFSQPLSGEFLSYMSVYQYRKQIFLNILKHLFYFQPHYS